MLTFAALIASVGFNVVEDTVDDCFSGSSVLLEESIIGLVEVVDPSMIDNVVRVVDPSLEDNVVVVVDVLLPPECFEM